MRDELDRILDEAIKSYAAIEPPPALPARILRQTQQDPAPQRNRWKLALALTLSLAAALALAFMFVGPMSLPKPPAPVALQPPTPSVGIPEPAKSQETVATATRRSASRVSVRNHAHPARATQMERLTARPLPSPYSKEELALLNFVQQHPKEAAEIAEAQKMDSAPLNPQPIAISQLEIKPLTIAPLN